MSRKYDDDIYEDNTRYNNKKRDVERRKSRHDKVRSLDDWDELYQDLSALGWPEETKDSTPESIPEPPKPVAPSIPKQAEKKSDAKPAQPVVPPTTGEPTRGDFFGAPRPVEPPTGANTHTIKGNIINFDRVINMIKVENERDGRLTYGIKFVFQSSNANRELSRIAWFNINMRERDRVFDEKQEFWNSILRTRKENKNES